MCSWRRVCRRIFPGFAAESRAQHRAALSGTPAAANGAAVAGTFRRHSSDPEWADDIEGVRELLYVEDRG